MGLPVTCGSRDRIIPTRYTVMAYIKTEWVDRSDPLFNVLTSPPLDADNLNKIEQGILDAQSGSTQDVFAYDNEGLFPATGVVEKIYIAMDTNYTYRWTGLAYIQIGTISTLTELDDVFNGMNPQQDEVLLWDNSIGWYSGEVKVIDGGNYT